MSLVKLARSTFARAGGTPHLQQTLLISQSPAKNGMARGTLAIENDLGSDPPIPVVIPQRASSYHSKSSMEMDSCCSFPVMRLDWVEFHRMAMVEINSS